MIDMGLLVALGASQTNAALYAPLLDDACPQWGIDTPTRVAAFLANCAHESRNFSTTQEDLHYPAQSLANRWKRFSITGVKGGPPNSWARRIERQPEQIANIVYANRYGNGPPESGDGWRFAGKGLIQTTFRANYEGLQLDWGADAGVDVVANPEILLQPEGAVVSACRFWRATRCNDLADAKDWPGLRARIQGGDDGLDKVKTKIQTALNYLGVDNG